MKWSRLMLYTFLATLSHQAFAGVSDLNCTADTEKAQGISIQKTEEGHQSNTYKATIDGFAINIHQLGEFTSDGSVPNVYFTIKNADAKMQVSSLGNVDTIYQQVTLIG